VRITDARRTDQTTRSQIVHITPATANPVAQPARLPDGHQHVHQHATAPQATPSATTTAAATTTGHVDVLA
jgi:hypothetical protein